MNEEQRIAAADAVNALPQLNPYLEAVEASLIKQMKALSLPDKEKAEELVRQLQVLGQVSKSIKQSAGAGQAILQNEVDNG